jgi:hypothetical protein
MSENNSFSKEGMQEKLELLKKQREAMLEQANRQMAQMDGAIGFIEQLLSGELDDNLVDEDAPVEPEIVDAPSLPVALPAKRAD